jgi:sortase (surface protein transpeptidase)
VTDNGWAAPQRRRPDPSPAGKARHARRKRRRRSSWGPAVTMIMGLCLLGWGLGPLARPTLLDLTSTRFRIGAPQVDSGVGDSQLVSEAPLAARARETPTDVGPASNTARTPVQAKPAIRVPQPPARLQIPKIGVNARIVRLGLRSDGTLQVPINPWRAGWFAGGARPGTPGTAVIVGHRDSHHGPALLHRLDALDVSDDVMVRDSHGVNRVFTVYSINRFDKDNFPSQRVYGATRLTELRLITCSGEYNDDGGGYQENLVVFARAPA